MNNYTTAQTPLPSFPAPLSRAQAAPLAVIPRVDAGSSPKAGPLDKAKRFGVYLVSLLGAAGIALQNTIAVVQLFRSIAGGVWVATRLGAGLVYTTAIALGGLCSGIVNFCVNIGLLEDFMERLTKKKKPQLNRWQQAQYWLGSAVFVATGVLFGMTAFALGSVGVLAIVGAAAGVFVAIIMTIQELETWLQGFDHLETEEKKKKKTTTERLKAWWASLTNAKLLSLVISVGNVMALSLLFTVGMTVFLMGVGVPVFPALMVGLAVSFTGGAFTEFYFYNRFLSDFCTGFKKKWKAFKETAYPTLGLVTGVLNAVVNGVLSYVGIMLLAGLLVAAGVGCPPLGVMMGVAITISIFAAAASFILGLDFWINNSRKIVGYFKKTSAQSEKPSEEQAAPALAEALSTHAVIGNVIPFAVPPCQPERNATAPCHPERSAAQHPTCHAFLKPNSPFSSPLTKP